jgi:hypothetical protein
MESVQQNYIGGTWVPAGATAPNVNPSNLNDVVANYARAQPAEAEAAIAAAKAAFSAYSRSTPQERYEALKKVSDEILARKDELGRLLSREEGKTLPEGIGEVVRAGQIFAFFAGESVRISRREDRQHQTRSRCRGHARAGWRRGVDHAVELSDCDPGLEDCAGAGLWQLRGVQASRSRTGLGARSCGDHLAIWTAGGCLQPHHGARQPDWRDSVAAP